MNSTSVNNFREYTSILTDKDFYRFDTSQDGQVGLRDFDGNDLFAEFVCRFAHSPASSREKYFQKMDRSLKIEIAWSLVKLARADGASDLEKKEILDVLDRDFNIVPIPEMTRDDAVKQFLTNRYWFSGQVNAYVEKDPILKRKKQSYSLTGRPGASLQLTNGQKSVFIAPSISVMGGPVFGSRTTGDGKVENYTYMMGAPTGSFTVADFKRDEWSVLFGGMYLMRTRTPEGFPVGEWNANGDLSVRYPLGWPVSLNVVAKATEESFAPPPEEGLFRSHSMDINVQSALTVNLPGSNGLIFGHNFIDNISGTNFTKQTSLKNSGSVALRKNSLTRFFDVGVRGDHRLGSLDSLNDSVVTPENTKKVSGGAFFRYFQFLGGSSSIDASVYAKAVQSRGDLDATYGGYEATLAGSFFLYPERWDMTLNGQLSHEIIRQQGSSHILSYSGSATSNIYAAKNFTITPSFFANQYVYEGKMDMNNLSMYGALALVLSLKFMKKTTLTLNVAYGKDWDKAKNYATSYFVSGLNANVIF